MKVLRQNWVMPGKGYISSISKDRAQLSATIEGITGQDPGIALDGEAEEITIPDESVFAGMVEADTVFLERDEMDIIDNAPEYK